MVCTNLRILYPEEAHRYWSSQLSRLSVNIQCDVKQMDISGAVRLRRAHKSVQMLKCHQFVFGGCFLENLSGAKRQIPGFCREGACWAVHCYEEAGFGFTTQADLLFFRFNEIRVFRQFAIAHNAFIVLGMSHYADHIGIIALDRFDQSRCVLRFIYQL